MNPYSGDCVSIVIDIVLSIDIEIDYHYYWQN